MDDTPQSNQPKATTDIALVKKTIAPLLTYSAIIGAALHYLGYVYLKSYLTGAGFYQPHVDISIQEAIFQGNAAIAHLLISIFEKFSWTDHLKDIFPTLLIASLLLTAAYSMVVFSAPKLKKSTTKSLKKSRIRTIKFFLKPKRKTFLIFQAPVVYAISLAVTFGITSVVIVGFVVLLSTIWLALSFGQAVGFSAGEKKAFNHSCTELKIEDIDRNKRNMLGCQQIHLSKAFEGEENLVGIRVFTSKDTIFFLTNDGSYEINNALEVVLFTSKHDIEKLRQEAEEKKKRTPFNKQKTTEQ